MKEKKNISEESTKSDDKDIVTCSPCEDGIAVKGKDSTKDVGTEVDDGQDDEVDNSHNDTDSNKKIHNVNDDKTDDQHDDVCDRCFKGGMLLCCDTCSLAYHKQCVGLSKLPDGDWSCPTCVIEFSRIDPYLKVRKGKNLMS